MMEDDNPYFAKDCMARTAKLTSRWYQEYLLKVLLDAKEKRAKDIDESIALARILQDKLNEKLGKPIEVPLREVVPSEDDSLMKPIDPRVADILYNTTTKGATERYLKERNKSSPEDKFYFRLVSSWDYGWGQKDSTMLGQDAHHGRCAILRDTFYRRNNAGPDPSHYVYPTGGETSICSEYACVGN